MLPFTVGIVGYGVVGTHLHRLFSSSGIAVILYDKHHPERSRARDREAINACDMVFITVPTPAREDGSCDITAVEEAVSWILPPMCIKSTIAPGTTAMLIQRSGKQIVFSPEYIGETPFHHSRTSPIPDVIAVGGDPVISELFLNLYRSVYGPLPIYFQTDAVTAELAKYMENCFFATKVAFVAQFYLLAEAMGANFTQMREIWVGDTRVGRSHSTVVGRLGFSGKCLPKDLSAIIWLSRRLNVESALLDAVASFNEFLCARKQLHTKTGGPR